MKRFIRRFWTRRHKPYPISSPPSESRNVPPTAQHRAVPLEIPLEQLESLVVAIENHNWAERVSMLLRCTNLRELTVSSDIREAPVPGQIASQITLPFLQSLDLDNPYLAELLGHVTLPQLRQLGLSLFGDRDDFLRIQALFSRAPCPIQYLSLTLGDPEFLRRIVALVPSVVELVLRMRSVAPDILGLVGTALQPGVLPGLQTFSIRFPTTSFTGRDVFVEMLMGRRSRLRSFTLHSAGRVCDATPYTDLVLAGIQVTVMAG
ncbi:hypothetical protein B0H12DRAFT_1118112 [Mycena haematopus]|nr:hypothetical protein B0H12DRAFT_1118112 [Mycena haematopus]